MIRDPFIRKIGLSLRDTPYKNHITEQDRNPIQEGNETPEIFLFTQIVNNWGRLETTPTKPTPYITTLITRE